MPRFTQKHQRECLRSQIRRKFRNHKCKHCVYFYFHSLVQISPVNPKIQSKEFFGEALKLYLILHDQWNVWYNAKHSRQFSAESFLPFYREVQGLLTRFYGVSWNNAVRISTLHRDMTFMWIDCQYKRLSVHQLPFWDDYKILSSRFARFCKSPRADLGIYTQQDWRLIGTLSIASRRVPRMFHHLCSLAV